ncbi:MAG: glycosyltransferase [Burkholderiales bacterium]
MSIIAWFVALAACVIWSCLLFARGGFWRAQERDDAPAAAPAASMEWPAVVAIVPARDEAPLIAETLGSLLRQRYPGSFSVILVDDHSADGTAACAREAAAAAAATDRLTVLAGAALPPGWSGKLWAVAQGVHQAQRQPQPPEYLWFTDADIAHEPDALAALVTRARQHDLVLTSLMVKLRCESLAERALIPAFVFFFQMLYPFRWVNSPGRATAAAAGGCILVRTTALAAAGGIEAIRGALIDDCALARRLKAHGRIWLGLTERAHSIRPYVGVREIRRMVARTAYVQLRESPLLLAATVLGMVVTYLAPPLTACFAGGAARLPGIAAWAMMAFAYQPTLRLYRRSWLWGLALPAIAAAYLLFTLDSAWQHWRGAGGMWKGRAHAG